MTIIQSTGSKSVDAMLSLNIQGNMIPFAWYQTILRANGKPHLLAITILSDLVYWFKPVEIRDEESGGFIGWKKRFKADLLQKSYQNYMDLFGESKHSVKTAMDVLEELGVIRREFREVKKGTVIANNVMFIDLNVDVLKRLTYPEMVSADNDSIEAEAGKPEQENGYSTAHPGKESCDSDSAETPPSEFCDRVVQNSARPSLKILWESPSEFWGTNTENTKENTTKEYLSLSIHQKQEQPDGTEVMDKKDGSDESVIAETYMELIRENICYDALISTDSISDRNQYEEMYLLICDVVCHKRKTIRIGGEDLPWEMVKSRFLKLNMQHIRYVAHAIQNATTAIGNIRAYLLTALYYAPTTMTAYWSQKANHDIHNGEWKGEPNNDDYETGRTEIRSLRRGSQDIRNE